MIQKCHLLVLVFIFLFYHSQGINLNKTEMLNRIAGNNNCEKIPALLELANYYHEIDNDDDKADSLVLIAISSSEKEKDKTYMVKSYIAYADVCTSKHISDAAIFINKALSLAQNKKSNDLEFLTLIGQARFQKRQKMNKEAQNSVLLAQPLINNNPKHKFLYHLTMASLNDGSSELIVALDNYNRSLEIATQLENDSMLLVAYQQTAKYCIKHGLYNKAEYCLDQAKDMVNDNTDHQFNDYDKLYLNYSNLEFIALTQPSKLLENGEALVTACEKFNFHKLALATMGAMRLSFMKNNDIGSLCNMYCQPKYINHLSSLFKEQPDMYYRIQALLQENNDRQDSAVIYWNTSLGYLKDEYGPAYLANFYLRFGQYFARHQKYDSAIKKFNLAYDFGKKSGFLPLLIEVTKNMDSIYYKNNMLALAYQSLKENKQLSDSNNNILQQEIRFMIEAQSSKRLEDIDAKLILDNKNRTYFFQLFIIGLIGILLVYALVVFSKKSIPIDALRFFGYITFIFLFEFLIFLLHNVFHHITEQPLYLMFMNVALIAILLPLHHATEHRFLHYLIKRNRIEKSSFSLGQYVGQLIDRYRNWIQVKDEY